MIKSLITDEFLKSFLNFQIQCPAIEKDGVTLNKDGKSAKYKYATLPQILLRVTPILNKNGLVLNQLISGSDGQHIEIKTILAHISGGMMIASILIPLKDTKADYMNALQGVGNTISYYKRYQITSILNLVSDEDNDGSKFMTDDEIEKWEKEKAKAEAKAKADADARAKAELLKIRKVKGPLSNERIEKACNEIMNGNISIYNTCQGYDITKEQSDLLDTAKYQSESFAGEF